MGINYQGFSERVHRYPVRCSLLSGIVASGDNYVSVFCSQLGGFARIGVALDSATPCRNFYAVEGIGLTSTVQRYANSDVGSGRVVQSTNSHTFKKAKVWVLGSTTTPIRKCRSARSSSNAQ